MIPNFTDVFILDYRAYYEVWRFVTAIFLHGSVAHILYNGFALLLFGSILEYMIGGKKFLIVFFVTGIFANAVAVNFYSSALGASGAIFGVIGALIAIRPFMFVWAFGLPMPIIAAGVIWVAGDLIGVFVPSDVANIAHLAGIFLGIVLGAIFRSDYYRMNPKSSNSGNLILNESYVRDWEDQYLK